MINLKKETTHFQW